jgi:hypothetical protein
MSAATATIVTPIVLAAMLVLYIVYYLTDNGKRFTHKVKFPGEKRGVELATFQDRLARASTLECLLPSLPTPLMTTLLANLPARKLVITTQQMQSQLTTLCKEGEVRVLLDTRANDLPDSVGIIIVDGFEAYLLEDGSISRLNEPGTVQAVTTFSRALDHCTPQAKVPLT